MPLLKAEADKLSQNQLEAGVIQEIIERDDMFAVLPFMQVAGKAYVYNRENSLPTATFLDPNDTVTEGAATFTEVTARLRILAGDVDIDKFIQTTESNTQDQTAVQIAAKAKGVARKFHQTMATGDSVSNSKEFDGLWKFASAGQTINADGAGSAGAALSLTLLDQLCDMVPNGADVIVMRRGTIRAFRALLRATYGTDAVMQQLENFGRPMLTHNGIPVLMNEFLPAVETVAGAQTGGALCSVYAVRLNEVDGLHGIYGGPNAGVVVENIGTVQDKDATRIRLKWYVGMALKSTKSIARLQGVTNI